MRELAGCSLLRSAKAGASSLTMRAAANADAVDQGALEVWAGGGIRRAEFYWGRYS